MAFGNWLEERSAELDGWESLDTFYAMGAFSPDRPSIDLLPLYYARFGSLLDPTLRNIQLRKDGLCWMLIIWRAPREVREQSVTSLLEDVVDDDPVEQVVRRLLDESVRFEVAERLGVFNHASLRVMVANALERERAHDRGYNIACEHWRPTADFGLACAARLSAEIASGIDLVDRSVRVLKSESATGILGDEPRTRWDEIVSDVASIDSMLSEGFRSDVLTAVYDAFESLPRVQQIAVWMSHDHIQNDFEDTPRGWETGGMDGFKLHDLHIVLEDVLTEVLGVAQNEADSR